MPKTAVRARALATLLADAPEAKILSLDCFDTLIWRNVNAPVDVFADLALPGGGGEARVWAESRARRIAPFETGRSEVTIDQIYAALMPGADPAARAAAIETELDAEARHCFAFAPVRDLILDAKRRRLQVVIVSDTYLGEPRLRRLIARVAGDALAAMIDRIFCSCDYGMSKAGGLFEPVLAALGASPASILHVGDNRVADQEAPAKFGIPSVHFEQFDMDSEQRLRFEAAAAAIVEPATRVDVPTYQPHRVAVSLRGDPDPAAALGHDVLGPLMHGFAHWLADEADAMEARLGRPVKLLFLLRDGHLPMQAFAALFPGRADRIAAVEISRFTAAAASFADEAAIARHVLPELAQSPLPVLARQLLFDRDEVAKLTRSDDPEAFAAKIAEPANRRRILARSRDFAQRLFAHLGRSGVTRGDAVMLVDLGYNGSVQNMVEPVLRAGMGLEVAGRYLLLRENILSGRDKAGLFDVRHYDSRLLDSLAGSIAVVEQLCTLAQGSVIDYRANGAPIRSALGVKNTQSLCRDRAQAACLDFVRTATAGVVRAPVSDDPAARRRMAAAVLARLLFLPLESEVALFRDFHHDANLGTRETFRIVDTEAAASEMRRRGIFYAKNAMRIHLPGELQQHGLPLTLANFGTKRFGLDLRKADFDVGAMALPVLLMDGQGQHAETSVEAHPTVEGYYRALVPVGVGRYTVGIQLGQVFDWVQIEEAGFHYVDDFLDSRGREGAIAAQPLMEGMEEASPGLYRSEGAHGFMMVPPPVIAQAGRAMLFSLVFRPVVRRSAPLVQQKAA